MLCQLVPRLSPILNHKTQNENSLFSVTCSLLEGSQPVFFEWFKNGNSIKAGPDNQYKIDTTKILTTFYIEQIARSDSGNYTCLVKNEHGSDSQNVLLNVKGMFNYIFIKPFHYIIFGKVIPS